MIEITEVVETTTWATVPCRGQGDCIQVAVEGDYIHFHRGRSFREGSFAPSALTHGAMRSTVRAFVVAVRRLQRNNVGSFSWIGQGTFSKRGTRTVRFTTLCGEIRDFSFDDLVALAEWAQEPDPA